MELLPIKNKHSSRREQHPLFNSIVLERIFSSFTIHNLKSLRLVCQLWNKIASPLLQSNSKVVLVRGRGVLEKIKKRNSFKEFIDFIETVSSFSAEQVFFRNYHLEHWIINEKREKNLHAFWQRCGPSMKELHLDNIIFYEVETIRNVLYNWTPRLESLRIEDCLFYTITKEHIPSNCEEYLDKEDFDEEYIFFDYYDHITVEQLKNVERDFNNIPVNLGLKAFQYEQWSVEEMPLGWDEIFAAFPNLKTLKLAGSIFEDIITDILSNASVLKLESLSFLKSKQGESRVMDSHLVQICDFKPGLTHLEICFDDRRISFQALAMSIKEHCRSLQVLKLYCPSSSNSAFTNNDSIFTIFPFQKWQFPKLTTLSLSRLDMLRAQSFPDCFEKIKTLITLKLWDGSNEYNSEQFIDIFLVACTKTKPPQILLNSLQTFSCGYAVKSCPFYEMVFSACPNLKVLKAPLNNEQIRIVYKYLSLLEEITVYENYLTDEGFTGNPILLSEFTEWNGEKESQREYLYIGDLKKLREFTLQSDKYRYNTEITDASVYQGFIDVTNLAYLNLTNTGITTSARRDLAKKYNNIQIYI